MPDETILGFDGTVDDTSLVVMHRHGGVWQVESVDGPDGDHLARMVESLIAEQPPARPWPAGTTLAEQVCARAAEHPPEPGTTLAEQVRAWLAAHPPEPGGLHLELTDWQRDLVQAMYDRLKDGTLATLLKAAF